MTRDIDLEAAPAELPPEHRLHHPHGLNAAGPDRLRGQRDEPGVHAKAIGALGDRQAVLLVEAPPDQRDDTDDPDEPAPDDALGGARRENRRHDQRDGHRLGEEPDVADQDRRDEAPGGNDQERCAPRVSAPPSPARAPASHLAQGRAAARGAARPPLRAGTRGARCCRSSRPFAGAARRPETAGRARAGRRRPTGAGTAGTEASAA